MVMENYEAASRGDIDYMRGFKAHYEDPNFKHNLLIGSIHMLIPIVGPIVLMGWYCEIMQRLVRRHPNPIPKLDFNDFGFFLGRGVAPFLTALVIVLPAMIVGNIIIFSLLFMLGIFAHHSGPDPMMTLIASFLGMGVMAMIILPISTIANAGVTQAELSEDFKQSTNFRGLLDYAGLTWQKVLFGILVYIPISMIFVIAGMICCFVGIYPAVFLLNSSYVFLRWQIYEYALAKGSPAIAVKAAQQLPSETVYTAPPSAPSPPA